MPRQSKGKGLKYDIERVGWRETSLNATALILSMVKEAAAFAPFQELRRAASAALVILQTIQAVKDNKEAYERLGDDSGGLVVAIWRSYKKAEVPTEWLSPEMREILEDLTHTLDNISTFVQEQLSRSKAIRVIFSRADTGKINEYREHLNYAMQKFELQSHMNINDVLMQLMRLSEQILHRNDEEDGKRLLENTARESSDREEAVRIQEEELEALKKISSLERLKQVEIDNQAGDDESDTLKRIEQEAKDRKLELERLRAAASALELANRLKKAREEEEEIALLKRQLAAQKQGTTIQSQSRKEGSSKRRSEVEEGEGGEWEGDVTIEDPSSEEVEVRRPVGNSKVKKQPSKSPNRRPASLNDEDFQSRRRSSTKTGRRKLSNASLRVDDSTDGDEDYVPLPPRNSSKDNRRPHSSASRPSRDVDDMTAQFGGYTPWGLGSPQWNGPHTYSGSPTYFPIYGSPPMGPYGYQPGTVINSGVGNITNSTISNVGNNNSVKKVYHTPRTRSKRRSGGG